MELAQTAAPGSGQSPQRARPSLTPSVQTGNRPGRPGRFDLGCPASRALQGRTRATRACQGGHLQRHTGQASRPRALRALCLQRHRACNLTHNGPGGPVFTSSWRIPRISPPGARCEATPIGSAYCGAPSRALLQRRPGLVQVGLSVFMPFRTNKVA
jgi:hypothetical protein